MQVQTVVVDSKCQELLALLIKARTKVCLVITHSLTCVELTVTMASSPGQQPCAS